MGSTGNDKRISIHAINKHDIPVFNIMLHYIITSVGQQIDLLEAKGIGILYPILLIETYLFAWFADVSQLSNYAELTKNFILSLIGLAMGIMGMIRMYIGTKRMIRKYLEEEKQIKNDKAA